MSTFKEDLEWMRTEVNDAYECVEDNTYVRAACIRYGKALIVQLEINEQLEKRISELEKLIPVTKVNDKDYQL